MSGSSKKQGTGAAVILALLVTPFTTVIYGATLAKLWEWFVADTFGVLAISALQAVGLATVVAFVTYQYDARKPTEDIEPLVGVLAAIAFSLVRSGFALLFGAIVKAFL